MTATYDCIATTTLGSDQASVTFSAISGNYTDLVIVGNGALTAGAGTLFIRFNSDTGSNYSNTWVYGNGTSAVSDRYSNQSRMFIGNWYTTFDNTFFHHIQNYSNTTTYKTVLTRIGNAGNVTWANVGLWRSTSAITSITLDDDDSRNFASGSTFSLFGIKAE